MGAHWLTKFDEDGEPYGVVCHCGIGDDHYASGRLTDFLDEEPAAASELRGERADG